MRYLLIISLLLAGCGEPNATGREARDKTRITDTFTGKRTQCYGVINGALTNEHPGVTLLARQDGDYIVSRCTGTFVSDTTVVTAAHCVDEGQTNIIAFVEDCSGSTEPTIVNSTAVYHHGFTAADFEAVEGSTTETDLFKLDLAVVTFPEGSATTTRNLSPAQVTIGDEIHFVGYGISVAPDHKDADRDIDFSDIEKREGKNTVTEQAMAYAVGTDNIAIIYDRNDALDFELGEYSNIAQGDSGGPLFLGDDLAGITSSGSIVKIDGSTTDIGFFIDLHSSDSRQLIADVADQGVSFTGLEDFLAGPSSSDDVAAVDDDPDAEEDPDTASSALR